MSETRIGLTDDAKAIFDVRTKHQALVSALRALEAELWERQEAHGRNTASGQVYRIVADKLAALLQEHGG